MSNPQSIEPTNEIAIVGMAGRFPGARSLGEFWRNLRDGVESISFYPEDKPHATTKHEQLSDVRIVRAAAPLYDPELFDASFFGFTPREAEIADPQQRLILECAWRWRTAATAPKHSMGGSESTPEPAPLTILCASRLTRTSKRRREDFK